jgi:type IV secretory pathway VirB2 component (pilin)
MAISVKPQTGVKPTMDALFGMVCALFVLALNLYAPWGNKLKQQLSSLAGSVALGAAFGLLALGFYLAHARSWQVWVFVVLAVMFPVAGIIKARREK